MRIRVEDAVDQNLLQVGAEEIVGELFAVDLGPLDAADRGDLGAADVVHREHACGRVVVHGKGNHDVLEVAELMGDGDEVARLFAVIELGE